MKLTAIMSEGAQFRHMKYPYTISAKVAQFPYKYYWNNCWMYRYLFYSLIITVPIFYKIQKLSYSPANVAKWDKIDREVFCSDGGHH